MSVKMRNSSIELLKIFAMVLIIISHMMPSGEISSGIPHVIDLNCASASLQGLLLILFRYCGQIGNAIFIVCSSYFLIESNKTKVEKIVNILLDTWMISIIYLISLMSMGYDITLYEVINNIFPLSFDHNWFVSHYIILYMIHPLLNRVIFSVGQKTLLIINMVLLILYSGVSFLLQGAFGYSRLIGFLVLYLLVAYTKLYLPITSKKIKPNVVALVLSVLGLVGLVVVTNAVALKTGFMSTQLLKWCAFINPFIIVMAVSLLNLSLTRAFTSRFVNEVSSVTLLVYLIHENVLLKSTVLNDIWKYIFEIYTYRYILVWVLIEVFVAVVVSWLLAFMYKHTLQRVVKKLCVFLYQKGGSFLNKGLIRLTNIK